MNEQDNIEDLIHNESLRCDAYIYKGTPFDFLKEMNKKYFNNAFNINKLYDFALDDYNYKMNNGFKHEAKLNALMSTLFMMFDVYEG